MWFICLLYVVHMSAVCSSHVSCMLFTCLLYVVHITVARSSPFDTTPLCSSNVLCSVHTFAVCVCGHCDWSPVLNHAARRLCTGAKERVRVTHIKSPALFFVQLRSQHKELVEQQNCINRICHSSRSRTLTGVEIGECGCSSVCMAWCGCGWCHHYSTSTVCPFVGGVLHDVHDWTS